MYVSFLESLVQHRHNHLQARAVGYGVRDNLSIEHVQDWGKIDPSVLDPHLRDIGGPFPIRCRGIEFPVEHIWGDPPKIALVGAIVPLFSLGFQEHLPHQLLDSLVVDVKAFVAKLGRDATVTVPPVMFLIYQAYTSPDRIVSVGLSCALGVVIEGGTSHPLDLQEKVKAVFRPQSFDGFRPVPLRRASLSSTKAFTFFSRAFSAFRYSFS